MNIGELSWPDPDGGGPGGYGRCNASCTTGRSMMAAAGLMMCSTSFITRTFSAFTIEGVAGVGASVAG